MSARTARRVAGCVAAGSLALMVGGLILAYVDRLLVPANVTDWDFSDVFGDVVNMAIPVMGFVLASRRPGNRIGWLALAAGLTLGLRSFADQYEQHALVAAPGSLPAGPLALWVSEWIWLISLALVAFLFLLFPTGRLRSRRWRPAAWFVGSVFALSTAAVMAGATREWANPSASLSQLVSPPVLAAMVICLLAALVVSGSAIVVRFARSAGEERLQLKWFAAAAVLVVVTFIALILTNSDSVTAAILNNLALLCLDVAIAVAVLKYRLYEIDRIISRTLAYTIVTGLLVGLYAGLVLLATHALSSSSPVAVAASTLVAAALFSPLRRRVQRVVDRRFNRARYDADEMMTAFAVRLKDAVDPDAVQADLASVVQRALEPAHVSMWVNNGGQDPGSGLSSSLSQMPVSFRASLAGRAPCGNGVRPDLVHLPGRCVHRRHRRPALCGVQGRAARTDPLPGLPARRNRGHGQRAGPGAGHRDKDAARRPGPAARQVPADRLGQPSQVADLAAAILANAYLTNQVISLDGGIYPRYAPDGIHHGVRTSWPGSR